jgi:hypothetical protein
VDTDPDPDPAFQVNPDPDKIRIWGFDDQKLKEKIQLIKLSIYSYLGLEKGCPSYRKSLQPSKQNIQHFKKGTN